MAQLSITAHMILVRDPHRGGLCSHLEEGSSGGSCVPSPATCLTLGALIQKVFTCQASLHVRLAGTTLVSFSLLRIVKTGEMLKKSEKNYSFCSINKCFLSFHHLHGAVLDVVNKQKEVKHGLCFQLPGRKKMYK